MRLLSLAESDFGLIAENETDGWPMTITAPDETTAAVTGLSFDISLVFDPETGQAVNGRSATVTLRRSTVLALGKGEPVNVTDTTKKPWLITVDDVNGQSGVFKVARCDPDRTLGWFTLFLEVYEL